MSSFTEILRRVSSGEERAADALTPLLYDELRTYVSTLLSRGGAVTLDATDIVHEAYLRLVDQDQVGFRDRMHFFAVAAIVVRRVLIDHVRRRRAAKRDGGDGRVSLDTKDLDTGRAPVDVLAVHEALEALAEKDPEGARIVELRFFGGMTLAEVGQVVGVSESAATRRWRYARAHLYRTLRTE